MMKIKNMGIGIMLLLAGANPLISKEVSLSFWPHGASASYTIIHDDFGGSWAPCFPEIDTMASNRGIKLSFAVVAGLCTPADWKSMKSFVAHGHEMVNHSWKHPNPTKPEWNDTTEMLQSRDTLDYYLKEIGGKQKNVTFFAFPFDAGTPEKSNFLKENGYLGVRLKKAYGGSSINSTQSGTFDPFYSNYYAFLSKEYGKNIGLHPSWYEYDTTSTAPEFEIQHLQATVKKGGWGFVEYHNVSAGMDDGGTWSPISRDRYRQLLDMMKQYQEDGTLWITGPTDVIRYIETRNRTSLVLDGDTIRVNAKNLDPRYATTVSVKISDDISFAEAVQDGVNCPVLRNKSGRYIDIDPLRGDLILRGTTAVLNTLPATSRQTASIQGGNLILSGVSLNATVELISFSGRILCSLPNLNGSVSIPLPESVRKTAGMLIVRIVNRDGSIVVSRISNDGV